MLPPPVLQTRTDRTRKEDPSTPLQRISLELSRKCNLRCLFCYSCAGPEVETGLTDAEISLILKEAVELGACLVSLVGGGEPLLRDSLLVRGESCIDQANAIGCYCCLYTNGILIDREAATGLFERDLTVVGKLNSLRESVQDSLTGVPGSAIAMRKGIDALLRAGFADADPPRLGLESVICRQNYDELPELWRWMRRRKIVPEVEIPTLHGRARENQKALFFDESEASEKYRQLFEELLAIDRQEFGYTWVPHPPFVAGACRLYYSNCYVHDQGGVQPCAGVTREYGILRVGSRKQQGTSLREIVTSEEFRKLRRVHELLTGACAGCDMLQHCYGCRGAAYHKTGDLFGEDPVCWRRPAAAGPADSCCTSSLSGLHRR